MHKKLGPFVLIFLVFFVDHYTKDWILKAFKTSIHQGDVRGFYPVTEFFHLVLVYNRGVSFGFFNGLSIEIFWILTGIISFIALYLIFWLCKESSVAIRYSLALIIGGALGNIMDRVTRGAVVDFLDFFWHDYHWPAFNIADACIVVGVCVLMILTFLKERSK